jgi:hypothetical protein
MQDGKIQERTTRYLDVRVSKIEFYSFYSFKQINNNKIIKK